MGKFCDARIDETGHCTACNDGVSHNSILTCTDCLIKFHADCDNIEKEDIPCTKSFLHVFHANSTRKPNFSWRCDACVTEKDTTAKIPLNEKVNELSRQIELLTKAMTDTCDKVNALTPGGPLPPATADISTNPWTNSKAVHKLRSSLLVKPDPTTGKPDIKKITEIVSKNHLQVHNIGVSSSTGNTFINCPSESARDTLQKKLREDDDTKNYKTEPLQGMQPTINIVGVTPLDWEIASEDPQERINALTLQLKNQNDFLDTLVTSSGETFKILFIKPPNGSYKNYQIVARVSPAIRYAIRNNWDKLYIGATSVRVHDRFYVKRCFKCNGFGHYTAKCTGAASCGTCGSDNHESRDCPDKDTIGTAHHKCINCKKNGKPHEGHNAASSKCPTYMLAQTKLKGNIAYYDEKNWPPALRH